VPVSLAFPDILNCAVPWRLKMVGIRSANAPSFASFLVRAAALATLARPSSAGVTLPLWSASSSSSSSSFCSSSSSSSSGGL